MFVVVRRRAAAVTAALAALGALVGGLVLAGPASADDSFPAVLDVGVSVDRPAPTPGQTFTYTIHVGCSSADCVGATVVDQLPSLFDALTVNSTVIVTGAPATYTWTGANAHTLTVTFTRPLDEGGTGLASGDGPSILVTVTVPPALSPNWAGNGVPITNTAQANATNAASVSSGADVTVVVPFTVSTATGAVWAPGSAQFHSGTPATLTVTTRNTSNALADSLGLAVPSNPAAANSLFDLTTLAGFGTLVFPQGADLVTVDAFVGGVWVPGTAAASAALPGGVDPTTVTGLRITFTSSTGTTIVAGGTAGSLQVLVTQRTASRIAGTPLATGQSVAAPVLGTVTVPGHGSGTSTATATYTITPLTVSVSATSALAPVRIPAGASTTVTATGKNTSNGPLDTLTVSELTTGILSNTSVHFDFFTGTPSWPAGATSAQLTWSVATGGSTTTVPGGTFIASDTLPAPPALAPGSRVVGFSVVYSGAIAAGATAALPFRVTVAPDAVAGGELDLVDRVQVGGTNEAGTAAPATATSTLQVLAPVVVVNLTKTVTPSAPVRAGGRSVVQLRATTSSDAGHVTADTVTIIDQASGSGSSYSTTDYWNAFDATAVAPTPVPSGTSLDVFTTTDHGATWQLFDTVPASITASFYQRALPVGVIGVKFVFHRDGGFAQSTQLTANLAFTARGEQRFVAGHTAEVGDTDTYLNTAEVSASGQQPGGGEIDSAVQQVSASGSIQAVADPNGGFSFDKQWALVAGSATVPSESGLTRTVKLGWGNLLTGSPSVAITDPSNWSAPVSQTVFNAFDLSSIAPITSTLDPLMAYDQVSAVDLYNGTSWVPITSSACPTASSCLGTFPGYTLTAAQRSSTVGVRITFTEWSAGRLTDGFAPPVGSGVASGTQHRELDLVFQLRNVVRVAGSGSPWATGARVFNDTDPGSVSNSAGLTAGSISVADADSILLIDAVPGLSFTKTSNNGVATPIAIPIEGQVATGAYPTARFTLTATNTSTARAWYLRVTDQMPCSTAALSDCVQPGASATAPANPYAGKTWDPATSPFNQFTITKLSTSSLVGTGIDPTASSVILWKADGTTQTLTLTAALALNAAGLANVVGVSALYTGPTSPATDGGAIAGGTAVSLFIDTQLRSRLRSDATAPVVPGTVTNSAFAQSWDGVFDTATPSYSSRSATMTLTSARLDVTATDTIAPGSIVELNRATTTVTVTMGATSGTATASPQQLTIAETDPAFWDDMQFGALGAVTKPAGANLVQVDLQLDGGGTWITGTAAAAAALPTLPPGTALSQITGIRFVFTKTAGALFSVTAPAASWTSSVKFTATLRAASRSGTPIVFPGSIPNTATATVDNPIWGSLSATAATPITLDPGTFQVAISKTPASPTTPAGQSVDYTISVKNTGTGYLDNPTVTDQLPVDAAVPGGGPLSWDPTSEVLYTVSAGGMLPSTGQTIAYDSVTRALKISWPAGSRIAPGETETLTIPMQVAPGLQASYGPITNKLVFGSDETLAACTNPSGNGQPVTRVGTTCTTPASVSVISSSAITSFKGVKGDVDAAGNSTRGAVNVNNAVTPCVPDAEGFYRQPCAAYTVIGGADLWKLRVTNGGNVPASAATVVDVLPRPGDTYLRSGATRGSTYRPVFAGAVALATDALAAGTTMTWQVSTAATPCANYSSDPVCSATTWLDGATFPSASYGSVTAIRVVFGFAALPSATLPPAATLTVTYRTVNTPSTSALDQLAPTAASSTPSRAWNAFGVHAVYGVPSDVRTVEPVRAGVQLATGSVQVAKAIAGPGAAYAPTSFAAQVACTVGGVAVTLPSGGVVTLAAANATPYTARVDGIPLGSACRITETTPGASSVDYAPAASSGGGALVTVTTAGTTASVVPVAQRATITNSYGTTSIRITKQVSTSATVGSFGPFAFTLACTADTGSGIVTVPLAGTDASFSLADGATKVIDNLPVTATCTLRETDAAHADSIQLTTASGTTSLIQNQPGTITLGTAAAYDATVTNRYEAGQLAITKILTGNGSLYGSGTSFGFHVACSYNGQPVFSGDLTVIAGATSTLAPLFPAGTSCAIHETEAGGATVAATDRTVLIPAPAYPQTVGLINVGMVNAFTTGSVTVAKSITGAGWARFGAGPYTAQVSCTWSHNGSSYVIPLPGAGIVQLTQAGGWTDTITGVIAGAQCSAVELVTGGATQVTVAASSPAAVPAGGETTIAITNRFDYGTLEIDKVRTGDAAARYGDGPFTVQVACGIDTGSGWLDLNLGSEATQVLNAADSYSVVLDDLLVGAQCQVSETDPGLAVTSALTPADGTVVIPATGAALVTVTNTFLQGSLHIDKTASVGIAQGGTTFDYTLAVSNTGEVDAAGVHVSDPIDPELTVEDVVGSGWTCTTSGGTPAGGTLECDLDTVLAVGQHAPHIVVTVTVDPLISADELVNTATASSTTPTVDGDEDTVTVPIKWLAVALASQCVLDAPWLNYSVDAHNLDVSGHTMTVTWSDAADTPIHVDQIPIAADGTITGRLLWPGATVDGDGRGTGWPGWRIAHAGETPTWENLVEDPSLPDFGLRSGAHVTISINPQRTVQITYPPASASCAETPSGRDAHLTFTKTASVTSMGPGGSFDYRLSLGNDGLGAAQNVELDDPIPASLTVLGVAPAVAVVSTDPAWSGCTVTGRTASGAGGTVHCELDRDLGPGETAPDVVLHVRLGTNVQPGTIINIAKVTALQSDADPGVQLVTLAVQDSATVSTAGHLAMTGFNAATLVGAAFALFIAGLTLALIAVVRNRRRPN